VSRGVVAARGITAGAPDAPLVALVHGLEDSWQSWRPLAAHLDPNWRVVGLDMPWRAGNDYGWRHGESSAGWLARGFDALATEPDIVVAHSYAANAMLELAARGQAPAARTVLVCPLYWSERSTVTWAIFDRSRCAFDAHIRESIRARLGRRAAGAGSDVVDAMTEVTVRRVGPSGFLAAFDQFLASGWLDLTRVSQPTLFVAGMGDR
jgi:pimeloyl-ACP methyl ester carboxylesterase